MNARETPVTGESPSRSKSAGSAGIEPNGTLARRELKYVVPEACRDDLRRDLSSFLVCDRHAAATGGRGYTVRSLYFDTPNIRFYYEKLNGENCRFKVRIRRYETERADPSDWFFEIKSKYHNASVKPRRLPFGDALLREHLRNHGSIHLNKLLDQISDGRPVSRQPAIWGLPLEPKVLVVYDREPLVDPRRSRVRVTLDSNLRAIFSGDPYHPLGPSSRVPVPALLEVKFEKNIPFWLEAVIRKYELRMESTSKYAHGVESAFPLVGLPRVRAFSDEGVAPSALGLLKNSFALGGGASPSGRGNGQGPNAAKGTGSPS